MPSLEVRVADQRDTVMAHGPDLRLHAERVHTRLRHPAVLIPAFLSGMLIARGSPVLRALPGLTARLRHITAELRKFHAVVTLIAALVPMSLRPCGVQADGTSAVQSHPRQQYTGHRPPRT